MIRHDLSREHRWLPLILLIFLSFFVLILWGGCRVRKAEENTQAAFKSIVGSVGGGPIQGDLFVSVMDAATAKPLKGAIVYLHQGHPYRELAHLQTGPQGTVVFHHVQNPVTVTVVCEAREAYDTITWADIETSRLVIPMILRKKPPRVQVALNAVNLDEIDAGISLFCNDIPWPERPVDQENHRLFKMKVLKKPTAFSAMTTDKTGRTVKFGWTIFPGGPPRSATSPVRLKLSELDARNVKKIWGHIHVPFAEIETEVKKDDSRFQIKGDVLADAGLAGYVTAGFVNIKGKYDYEAYCCRTPGLKQSLVRISVKGNKGAEQIAFLRKPFDMLPERFDFSFNDIPEHLRPVDIQDTVYPLLTWQGKSGELEIIHIEQPKYDYTWRIYRCVGTRSGKLEIPPLEPGSAGALMGGEIYTFQVQNFTAPGLNRRDFSFQEFQTLITHISISKRQPFEVAAEGSARKSTDASG